MVWAFAQPVTRERVSVAKGPHRVKEQLLQGGGSGRQGLVWAHGPRTGEEPGSQPGSAHVAE